MLSIVEQIKLLLDPSQALGAFLISVLASLFVGFFSGKEYQKKVSNTQKTVMNNGNMVQNNNNSN